MIYMQRDLPAKARINNFSRVDLEDRQHAPTHTFLKESGIQVVLEWIYGILTVRSINHGLKLTHK